MTMTMIERSRVAKSFEGLEEALLLPAGATIADQYQQTSRCQGPNYRAERSRLWLRSDGDIHRESVGVVASATGGCHVLHETHTALEASNRRTCEQVLNALNATGYPLKKLSCQCSDTNLTLNGRVTRYFYLQMAVQVARRLGGGRKIGLEIEVDDSANNHAGIEIEPNGLDLY